MDIGTALIGGILMAICVLPIVLMNRGKKIREKKALQALAQLAEQHHSRLGEREYCGDCAIGMDEGNSRVFFYQEINGKVVEQMVELARMERCQVLKVNRPKAGKGVGQQIINRLGLSFTPAKGSESPVVLEFYNTEVKLQLSGELEAVERWSKRINEHLRAVGVA